MQLNQSTTKTRRAFATEKDWHYHLLGRTQTTSCKMQLAFRNATILSHAEEINETLAVDWSSCACADSPNTCLLWRLLNESLDKVPRIDLRLLLERAFGSGCADFTHEGLSPRALECNKTAYQTPRGVKPLSIVTLAQNKHLGQNPWLHYIVLKPKATTWFSCWRIVTKKQ